LSVPACFANIPHDGVGVAFDEKFCDEAGASSRGDYFLIEDTVGAILADPITAAKQIKAFPARKAEYPRV